MANENIEYQVVLMKAKSFTDGKYKFKQGVPVTMPEAVAKKYAKNWYFSVRTIKQAAAMKPASTPRINPAATDNKAVSEESVRVPKRAKLKSKSDDAEE